MLIDFQISLVRYRRCSGACLAVFTLPYEIGIAGAQSHPAGPLPFRDLSPSIHESGSWPPRRPLFYNLSRPFSPRPGIYPARWIFLAIPAFLILVGWLCRVERSSSCSVTQACLPLHSRSYLTSDDHAHFSPRSSSSPSLLVFHRPREPTFKTCFFLSVEELTS